MQFAELVERISTVRASPEELAEKAAHKIIYVGNQSHPLIRDQALAFQAHIQEVVRGYLERAVYAEQLQFAQALRELGHPELVGLVEQRMKA
jgi:hypothetical protein